MIFALAIALVLACSELLDAFNKEGPNKIVKSSRRFVSSSSNTPSTLRLSFLQGFISLEESGPISGGADGESAAVATLVTKLLVSSELEGFLVVPQIG